MAPDFETAAIKAAETLIEYKITSAPVDPLPILKKLPGVLVASYAEMSKTVGVERKNLLAMFGTYNQDAVTTAHIANEKVRYLVIYNQQLPYYMMQRGLARELGHIILGHDGSRPEDVRNAEALHFAQNLLCPRALIHSVKATGIRLTLEVLGTLTGCYEMCLSQIRKAPATHVPSELNRQVRDQFMPYIMNFFEFQHVLSLSDGSALADFGTYMDGYKE